MSRKSNPSPDEVGAKRSHGGGTPQKYALNMASRKLIKERYDGTRARTREISRQLGVPGTIVSRWAAQMKLTSHARCRWLPDEIDYLENHLAANGLEAVAKRLHRSTASVKSKARKLGLAMSEGYTLRDLCDGLGVSDAKGEKWLQRGWIKAARRVNDDTTWNFTEKDICDFLRTHQEEIDLRHVDQLWFMDIIFGGAHGIGRLDNTYKIDYADP